MTLSGTWRFGAFELDPVNRRLLRDGQSIPLQPKAFDLLTVLVKNGGRLVARKELFESVWSGTEVEDANLTNNITALRKILGQQAIVAAPKYGYRFCLPVTALPGLPRRASDAFSEAQVQMSRRTTESVLKARDLFWLVIAHQPEHAPAWAWLGRACRYLEKFGVERMYHREIMEAAFQQAFTLNPELACAHQFFTAIQVDRGDALAALERLLRRIREHREDAHSFVALVQACRFCGLLHASEESHQRALELDPGLVTSIPHTYFARCDYQAVVESYSAAGQGTRGYLDVSAWACLGFRERTEREIVRRLDTREWPPVFETLLRSLLHVLRGETTEVQRICLLQELYEDPETALYLARHLAFCGCADHALALLTRAIEGGLAVPEMLQCDPWLSGIRPLVAFERLLEEARSIQERGQRCLERSGVLPILFPAEGRRQARRK